MELTDGANTFNSIHQTFKKNKKITKTFISYPLWIGNEVLFNKKEL